MALTEIEVDETPHNMDGLPLHGFDGSERGGGIHKQAVMESWVDPREPYRKRRSLLRAQYNALGKLNLAAIERIAASKYQRGVAFLAILRAMRRASSLVKRSAADRWAAHSATLQPQRFGLVRSRR